MSVYMMEFLDFQVVEGLEDNLWNIKCGKIFQNSADSTESFLLKDNWDKPK